jgi:hypothetical protein
MKHNQVKMKLLILAALITTPPLHAITEAELCGFLDATLHEMAHETRAPSADSKTIRHDALTHHVTHYAQEYLKAVKVPVDLLQQDLQEEVAKACKAVIATITKRITTTKATSIASDELQTLVEQAIEHAAGPRFRIIRQQDVPHLVDREIDAIIDELGVPHRFITQSIKREIARTKEKIIKALLACIKQTRRTSCSFAEINTLTSDRSRILVKQLEYRLKWHIFQVEQARMIKPTDQLKTRVLVDTVDASELRKLYEIARRLELVKF